MSIATHAVQRNSADYDECHHSARKRQAPRTALESRKKAKPPIPPVGTGFLWLTTEIGGDVGHKFIAQKNAKIQIARATIMQSGDDCIALFEGKGAKPALLNFASSAPNPCSPRD